MVVVYFKYMVEIVILVIVLIAAWLFFEFYIKPLKVSTQKKPQGGIEHIKHRRVEHLATENERKLYYALLAVLPKDYVVHCQVSLLALVAPEDRKHLSKVWAKRMDYVVTDSSTKVLAVIELDDSTHNRPSRVKSDAYKDHALKGNHVLIRFQTKKFYDQDEVKAVFERETGIVL